MMDRSPYRNRSKREQAARLFGMYEAAPEIPRGIGLIFDKRKKLWRTTSGRPVLSRHFIDEDFFREQDERSS